MFSVPTKSNVTDMRITGVIPWGFLSGNAAILYFAKCHISVCLAERQDEHVNEGDRTKAEHTRRHHNLHQQRG